MPITPSEITNRKKPITFSYGDYPVNVEYRPAKVGPQAGPMLRSLMDRVSAASAAEDEAALNAALHEFGVWTCDVIASWDFMQDDGETPQVLTPDNIVALMTEYTDFIVAVFLAILQDRDGGKENGTPQSNGSISTSPQTAR